MRLPPTIFSTVALAALALAGCATTGASPIASAAPQGRSGIAEVDANSSNYGLFLAGEAALQSGRTADAAQYFTRAVQGAAAEGPEVQALIREKAFTAAIMSGDVDTAAQLAPPADPKDGSAVQRLSRLVRAVDALAQNKGKEADAELNAPGEGAAFAGGIQLLKPWAAAAAGDQIRATAALTGPAAPLTRVSAQFSRALLLERAKRYSEAEADYKALNSGQFAALYTIPYGEFLQRRGRTQDAESLYRSQLARNPASREIRRALDRVAKNAPPPTLLSIRQGAAQALTAAAEMSLIQKRFVDGQVFLRLAIRLDPQQNEAWVFLGDILVQQEDFDGGRAAYLQVPTSSIDWIDARQRLIASYQAQGDLDTALKMAQALVKAAPDDREALVIEADLLRAANRFPEAVAVLDKVIAADPARADWALYYTRGTALDRAGRWDDAEKDLTKALALRPDQPDVLNYLGYSWVNRGERLQQAMIMLQKAYLAQPDSGEIADSLGWAYYSMGDYKQAVQRLERAAALEPVNPEITDHLGDAYWRAGRRTEAQYQWSRVLNLSPTQQLKSNVQRKIGAGLDPDVGAKRS
jgi:Flp pilus assembly protein TadD